MLSVIEAVAFGLGTTELLIILAILMFIFGASKIPELGKSLGAGIRGFQKSVKGDDEPKQLEDEPADKEPEVVAVKSAPVQTEKVLEDKSEPIKEAVVEKEVETVTAKDEKES